MSRNSGTLRRAGRVAAAAMLVLILAATLWPSGRADPEPWKACLLCGTRGLADAIVNVALFLPLGAALVLAGWRARHAAIAAGLLSLGVETAQMYVPGRDPSFGDLLFNTLGGGLGAWLAFTAPRWLAPSPRLSARLAAAGAVVATAVIVATGLLFRPHLPGTLYYGQWTPNLEHFGLYDGRVISARLGDLDLPPRLMHDSEPVRDRLRAGAPLRVEAMAGPATPRLASIVSVYDLDQREIFVIGADRDDLVYRYRMRAALFRLDQPDIRWPAVLQRVGVGEPLSIGTLVAAGYRCLVVGEQAECGLGFTPGAGWSLLYYVEHFPTWLRTLLGMGWVAALVAPFAYWANRRAEALVGGALLIAALLLLPRALGLLPLTSYELAAAILAAISAIVLRQHLRSARCATRLRGVPAQESVHEVR